MKHARNILRALDRLDPVNEAVVRLAMKLDHSTGDGASLHRRYRQLCDRLETEFAAMPSEETRALFHALATSRGPASARNVAPGGPVGSACGELVPLVIAAPLQTGGNDDELSSLAHFCADDVRVSLSRMRGIQVLGLDGAETSQVLQQCQDALGIFLLSGSLRRFGGEYRAQLQLADAASRIILWSDSLRLGASEDAVLEAIVGKAAGAVLPAIDRELGRRLRLAGAEFDDERTRFTRARLLIRTEGDLPAVCQGVALLEQLLEANPRHLGAHLLLSRMYDSDFWQQIAGHDVRAFRARAEHHAQVAAAIEPGHYLVSIRQPWRHARKGQTGPAHREFEGASAKAQHDADATNQCAMGCCFIGRLDQAEQLMQRAFFLNPFPSSDYHADFAIVKALQGEHETAEEHFAVSGERGLMYAAVRLANAANLADGAGIMAPVLSQFVDGFRQAWQPDAEPALADVLAWAEYTLPLNPPEHRRWLQAGLRQTLEPLWPGAPGNPR